MINLLRYYWRGLPVRRFLGLRRDVCRAGLDLTVDDMVGHYLQGGDVRKSVRVFIEANNVGLEATFQLVTSCDLAGYDLDEVLELWKHKQSTKTLPGKPTRQDILA